MEIKKEEPKDYAEIYEVVKRASIVLNVQMVMSRI